jgi:hypothetical protein
MPRSTGWSRRWAGVARKPQDALWGLRYAVITDPGGERVDHYRRLPDGGPSVLGCMYTCGKFDALGQASIMD